MSPSNHNPAPPEADIVVWVVEDVALLRRSLHSLLDSNRELNSKQGIRCPVAVATCEEALAELEHSQPPDMVLMDIGLPGMDGIEGTRRIRAAAPSCRVIMLTVHEERENIFAAICAGASGYLLKPSRSAEILSAIREVAAGGAPINGYIARKMLDMFPTFARPRAEADQYQLTPREREVLELLVDGLALKEIAARLEVSFHTVNSHVRNIYEKLHVRSRGKAVAKALSERLLD